MTRIALILGGPSAKDLDVEKIDAQVIVAVNWGFLLGPRIAYNVVCDYRLMDRVLSDHVLSDGTVAVTRFKDWCVGGGVNFFVDHCGKKPNYFGTITVPSLFPAWPVRPAYAEDGLYCRNNVGLCGLNFACLLIPSKGEIAIYGLDLDVATPSGKTENWHTEHDPNWKVDAKVAYPEMLREWEKAAKLVPSGIRVVNMNPKSAFKGFEFSGAPKNVDWEKNIPWTAKDREHHEGDFRNESNDLSEGMNPFSHDD